MFHVEFFMFHAESEFCREKVIGLTGKRNLRGILGMQVKSRFDHCNFNVKDLDKSIAFYRKALGLTEKRRYNAPDGSFILVFMEDGESDFLLELTWLRDRKEAYNLGDNEMHFCVRVDGNSDKIRSFHKEMNCVCYENEDMGLYFIEDPDGYVTEIIGGGTNA
jgi:lactoylglutathione lyase